MDGAGRRRLTEGSDGCQSAFPDTCAAPLPSWGCATAGWGAYPASHGGPLASPLPVVWQVRRRTISHGVFRSASPLPARACLFQSCCRPCDGKRRTAESPKPWLELLPTTAVPHVCRPPRRCPPPFPAQAAWRPHDHMGKRHSSLNALPPLCLTTPNTAAMRSGRWRRAGAGFGRGAGQRAGAEVGPGVSFAARGGIGPGVGLGAGACLGRARGRGASNSPRLRLGGPRRSSQLPAPAPGPVFANDASPSRTLATQSKHYNTDTGAARPTHSRRQRTTSNRRWAHGTGYPVFPNTERHGPVDHGRHGAILGEQSRKCSFESKHRVFAEARAKSLRRRNMAVPMLQPARRPRINKKNAEWCRAVPNVLLERRARGRLGEFDKR